MADRETVHVFSYDISSERSRRRVAAALERSGVRVQGSVFEVRASRAKARRLADRLAAELNESDSLRVYVLARETLAETIVFGGAPRPELQDFWLA